MNNPRPDFPDGVLPLDKPAGLTSAAALNRIKRLLPRRVKVGHAGTLDPFATGTLLVLIGKATKLCESLMDSPKQYVATVRLGANTATDDLESPEMPVENAAPVSEESIREILPKFVGTIQQKPPIYSALKIEGKRACDRVRAGQDIQLQPRPVKVYGFELLSYAWPDLVLKIDCGRGTYIRSLARDIGAELSVGGYLTALRRTRVGEFGEPNLVSLDGLTTDQIIHALHRKSMGGTGVPPV